MNELKHFIIRYLVSLLGVSIADFCLGQALFSNNSLVVALIVASFFYFSDGNNK